jgi:drug/metabolite transporter (DMT)-like permease
MGILFALIALLAWGFGDFLLQRSTRKFGNWTTLFYVTAFAAMVLLPFVWGDIRNLAESRGKGIGILLLASAVLLVAALFDLEALRRGKIAVIESIYALEVFVTATLGASLIGERLTALQTMLTITLVCGIVLVSFPSLTRFKEFKIERGVGYAVLATVAMGAVNFLFGVGARETSPLLINWFTSTVIAVVALGYLLSKRQGKALVGDFKKSPFLILGVSIIDNIAWIAFAASAVFIPIAIATGLSESYIVVAALLGFFISREKLKQHQWIGFAVAVISAIALAVITEG